MPHTALSKSNAYYDNAKRIHFFYMKIQDDTPQCNLLIKIDGLA
jgi:hypothetical protein